MAWTNPALWTAIAGVIGAVAALLGVFRVGRQQADTHDLVVGHILDRTSHPLAPGRDPSSPAGPSSG